MQLSDSLLACWGSICSFSQSTWGHGWPWYNSLRNEGKANHSSRWHSWLQIKIVSSTVNVAVIKCIPHLSIYNKKVLNLVIVAVTISIIINYAVACVHTICITDLINSSTVCHLSGTDCDFINIWQYIMFHPNSYLWLYGFKYLNKYLGPSNYPNDVYKIIINKLKWPQVMVGKLENCHIFEYFVIVHGHTVHRTLYCSWYSYIALITITYKCN